MNITVYLGANEGNDPALHKAVTELGAWIGQSGNTLVYGGSKSGLMGALADSVLNAGGRAIGVEPQFFVEKRAAARRTDTADRDERYVRTQKQNDRTWRCIYCISRWNRYS